MTDKILVLSNCASREEAESIARRLLESRLAACVSILPGVQSLYHWQGAIEQAAEWTILIKTRRALFDSLSGMLRSVHSYQVPEILAVPVVAGSDDYLDWIERETEDSYHKPALQPDPK